MARSASSNLWRSVLARVTSQRFVYPSTSSYGALLYGFRSMSTEATCKLFIGGLSWSTDENALRDAFSSYGDISEAKVILDRETGRSKGFGFVSFVSTEDAESAKKGMDGNDLNGRTVRVDFAIEKPRSFGGFGGGNMGFGGQSGDSSFGDLDSRPNSSFSSASDSFENKNDFGSNSFGRKDSFASDSFDKGSFRSQSFTKDSFESKASDDDDSFGNDSFDLDSPGDRIGSKDRY